MDIFLYKAHNFLLPLHYISLSYLFLESKINKKSSFHLKNSKEMKHCRMDSTLSLSYKIQFSYLYSNLFLFLYFSRTKSYLSFPFVPPFLESNDRKLKGKSVVPWQEKFEWNMIFALFPVVGAKVRRRGRPFKSLTANR